MPKSVRIYLNLFVYIYIYIYHFRFHVNDSALSFGRLCAVVAVGFRGWAFACQGA